MTTASSTRKPVLQAEVTARRRTIIEEFVDVFHPDSDEVAIRFRVNRRDERLVSFTDYRGEGTGTAGTTGIWGTPPPQPAAKRCTLTPAGFRLELAKLVGDERAQEIMELLTE